MNDDPLKKLLCWGDVGPSSAVGEGSLELGNSIPVANRQKLAIARKQCFAKVVNTKRMGRMWAHPS